MATRPPIERWSRGELEDRFHSVADYLTTLKQKNNRLEREVKILNGRLNGRNLQRKVPNGPQRDELDELHRTNQLMAQKLKVLKHQLLNYTKVNSTTNLAGRYRPETAGQRQQQQKNGPVQRPQSAFVGSVDNQTKSRTIKDQEKETQQQRMQSQLGRPKNPRKRPISQPTPEENYEFDEESEHQFEAESSEMSEKAAEQRKHLALSEERKDNETKEKLREMQRQNRKTADENDELRVTLEKSEKRLSSLRAEYDRVVHELSHAQRELRAQSDTLSSEREDAKRRANGSARSAEIADRELAIVREECRALRNAHERLVEKSLQQENSGKAALEQLALLRAKIQQNANEKEADRREWEEEMHRLRRENAELRETRAKERDEIVKRREEEKHRENGNLAKEEQRSKSKIKAKFLKNII